ncbi:coenzyme F420-dependent NADP oxidoreductase [Advenella kashmirensis WT001]|uniref:Coenzyme F420-dependent NADP oxidoreductase n=1 Tax=Advenella kashmirensis (strain DSM 17095 / LMG 22695 / WT001) TaxID=1036672 RepID=I3UFZ1_ADVKW|nr:NADPH-dependent F420 reductase [Advenella kashmirensis]AFK63929.1 coenzyme F420-dependent NADP oxidoreductase [Advenella kashmirensis WT001]
MSYSIIGFGSVGQALARSFARKNIQVSVAGRRAPEALTQQAQAIGPTVVPTTLQEAIASDIIFLAVPFREYREVARQLNSWQGKTIIDATNAYGIPEDELEGQPSATVVAKAFSGASVVKGFNHLVAAVLGADPSVNGGSRVVFLSSDDESAVPPVAALAEQLGFAPIALGPFKEGGALVHGSGNTWGKLIFKDLVRFK